MLEKYYEYKIDYRDYIIFIKAGSFYECIDKDALIINQLFHYKIKRFKNNLKVGFPIVNLSKMISELENHEINYIVIDNDEIKKKKSFKENQYSNYQYDRDKILFRLIQTEKIREKLEDMVLNDEIDGKLQKITQYL